jgi:hypothetical protein
MQVAGQPVESQRLSLEILLNTISDWKAMLGVGGSGGEDGEDEMNAGDAWVGRARGRGEGGGGAWWRIVGGQEGSDETASGSGEGGGGEVNEEALLMKLAEELGGESGGRE